MTMPVMTRLVVNPDGDHLKKGVMSTQMPRNALTHCCHIA